MIGNISSQTILKLKGEKFMKKIILVFMSLVIAFSSLSVLGCQDNSSQSLTAEEKIKILEEAYVFAYPLVMLDIYENLSTGTGESGDSRAKVNQFFHETSLPTPDEKTLVRPNLDTLYSHLYLDLGDQPILVYKPQTDRYCTLQVFDGFSNTPYILGSSAIGGNDGCLYAFVGPDYDGELPDGVVELKMPTEFAWLLGRTRIFGTNDISNATAIQEKMYTCLLSDYDATNRVCEKKIFGINDPVYEFEPNATIANLSVQDYFTKFNKLLENNPVADIDKPAMEQFNKIGIGEGLTFNLQSLGDDVVEAVATLPSTINQSYSQANSHITPSNMWMSMGKQDGNFGTDYAFRTAIAFGGFANPTSMAVYPTLAILGVDQTTGNMIPLLGNKNYKLHFDTDKLPPYLEHGWWSITAYDMNGNLIDNEIDRYAFTDSGSGSLPLNADGSLDIYIQASRPDEIYVDNWLPVCQGVFSLTLRIYLPTVDAQNNVWTPPTITIVN